MQNRPGGRQMQVHAGCGLARPGRWHALCDNGWHAFREECAVPDTLIIADRDLDQAQTTLLAIRNAGFDYPIFYVRSSAALINRLSAPTPKTPRPSAILIDIHLLQECSQELKRCLNTSAGPIEVTALLSSERERFQLDQCGLPQVGYLLRPVKSMDALRLLGVRAKSRTPPVGNPRLLWPTRPDARPRPTQTVSHGP